MVRKNLGFIVTTALIILFLYYASQFNNPLNGTQRKKQDINFRSDVSGTSGMVVSASK